MSNKPKIIFFARDYQMSLFPLLETLEYESVYVTLTIQEKHIMLSNGINVAYCFEELYDSIKPDNGSLKSELETSFFSDRYFCRFSSDKRKDILAREFQFWKNVFSEIKPLAVINEVIAIEMAEVMFIEASRHNVQYWAWLVSPFKDKNFYWLSNPFHASLDSSIFQSEPSVIALEKANEYIQTFRESANFKPFYAENLGRRHGLRKLFFAIKRALAVKRFVLGNKPRVSVLADYYGVVPSYFELKTYLASLFYSYDSTENLDDEFIFYPLHYEPEASIIYFSEFHEDQIALIRNISKCLSKNQLLIVKEHPQQPGMLLTKEFRQLKRRLSNVLFLPAEASTKNLILKSQVIVTQTSTLGWEALILNKPVFVIGKVFYDKYPKINHFKDFENLRNSLKDQFYECPNDKDTLEYVAKFWDYCQYGNPYPNKALYSQDNLNFIRKSILVKLELLIQQSQAKS